MHTILGANGIIARELSRALSLSNQKVRQVSRHPQKVNANDEIKTADLLDAGSTAEAVAGSEVVYLVAGLPYNTTIWQEQWPKVMRNTINACHQHNARLVFFDNVYSYGHVDGPMTEETPFNPCSKKGEVRAKIATMLLDEIAKENIQALIARSADFYGPGAVNSFPYFTVFQRLKASKSPQWIGTPEKVHTFTFTPDAGKAVATLGQSIDAFGQTWHLPTTKDLLSGKEFVQLACELANQPYKLQVMPRLMQMILEIFVPILRENKEMMYQLNYDYIFDSSKIEAAYGLNATAYQDGINICLNSGTN